MEANQELLLKTMREEIEQTLQSQRGWLEDPYANELTAMVNHHFGWDKDSIGASGKRIRPLLTLLCCHAAGGEWKTALPAAAAVETIHNFSLIHDDIQDRSPSRRGRPTVWTKWGEAQAINTGDAVFVLAQLFLSKTAVQIIPAEASIEVSTILNRACLELTIGQHLDLAFESRSRVSTIEYNRMIRGKTAALLAAACESGAVLAGVGTERSMFRDFGFHLGMAFQLLDDILGIWGDEKTGKPTGDDIVSRKKTMPVLLGLEKSPAFEKFYAQKTIGLQDTASMIEALDRAGVQSSILEAAEQHTRNALDCLHKASMNPEGFTLLSQLAGQLLNRQS